MSLKKKVLLIFLISFLIFLVMPASLIEEISRYLVAIVSKKGAVRFNVKMPSGIKINEPDYLLIAIIVFGALYSLYLLVSSLRRKKYGYSVKGI